MRLTILIGEALPRTKGRFLYFAAFVAQIAIAAAAARAAVVVVSGSTDPYLAGMPVGSTASVSDVAPDESPILVPGVLPAAGSPITFTNVSGSVSNTGGTPTDPPDGSPGAFLQHLDQSPGSPVNPENGIADLIAPVDSLLGIFLGPAQPSLNAAPIGLDFSPGQGGAEFTTVGTLDFTSLAPLLAQPFFIGDGLANGTTIQTFVVPAGATRLYLGTMDGYGWNNNTGSFSVTVNETPAPVWTHAVPGQWSDASKWSAGVPNADGATAFVNVSTSAAVAITLDEPVTLGMLVLGSGTAGAGYTLNGGGSNTLTFSNTGSSASAQISVTDGAHSINAPVVLNSNLVVNSFLGSSPWTLSFGTASSITDNGNNLSLTLNAGNGTLILSGSNTYGGGTNVTAGTILATRAASLPGYNAPGQVSVAPGAVLAVQTGNGSTGWNSSQIDSLLGNATWTDDTAVLGIDTTQGSFTYGSDISAALTLAKLGANSLILTGNNSYTGGTTISGGTLKLGNLNALGTGGLTANNGTVDLAGFSPAVDTLNGSAGKITSSTLGGVSLTVNNGGTFNGTIQDDAALGPGNAPVSLILNGGVLALNGSNSYSGGTVINGGALQAIDGAGLPKSSNLLFNGNLAQNGYGAGLQTSGTFSRSFGSGAGQIQWTGDGGFAANGGKLTVSINNGGNPLVWNNNTLVTGTRGIRARRERIDVWLADGQQSGQLHERH